MAWDEDQKKCGGLTAFGLFTILVSAAMIVMGVLNLDLEADDPVAGGYCRAEVNIPVFLIGGGVVFILLLLFRFIFQRVCRKCNDCCGDNKLCSTLNFAGSFTCILLYDILAFVVVLAVLIFGTQQTCDVWDTVVYSPLSSPDYCPESLYTFSYVLLAVLWLVLLCALTCGLLAKFCACFYNILCCKPCKKADEENQAV